MPNRSPAIPNKTKGFKRGTKHKSLLICACGCLNRINDDGEVSSTRIVNELRAVRDHCDHLLNELLVEAVTGVERAARPQERPTDSRKTRKSCPIRGMGQKLYPLRATD
jgi:hypothetical protein